MLEYLTVSTGIELGKLVLQQVLDLGQPVMEGYVQDFFAGCLESGVARLNATRLKPPMAEAIGFFIQRFVKELQFNDVPETSIAHHYNAALRQFVRDKAVCLILGKAFETGCKQIDYTRLQQLWTAQDRDAGWQFPTADFDWRGVAKEYVVEVKAIVKADAELRALLTAELLETIAQNTAPLSPGFDLARYRQSLQCSYGYLKLYTLDSTDRVDAVKLWNLFVEQTVREALPPMRYDLPLDVQRQLADDSPQSDGPPPADLSPAALEQYRRQYFQQPARKALAALTECQRAVILGDPGAGKSTLLQYLALDWVEGKTEALPLLIELRDYALAQSASILDFLHRGRGADWQFDPQQLHQHLLEQPTLALFDGLDEVFDRATQAAVIDDIIRFAQQYPKARVLVTSRIIGYNPERFQHAGFRQFTLQPLDESEIHTFIDRWYDLALGRDPDKVRLKQRLRDAITNSKAIQALADNPLLLTMMAILNRRQELPRDRADLYDQASRVLLYHWDVDHKRLQLPLDTIGRREKQEMLRLIAHEMQAGDAGLKGNLIGAEPLTRILTDYLRDQGFSQPREKANRLIQQLRERNFILCYRGADTYGFVHRTFLEYFCAVEIVHRFEKQQTLTFEQLRDEVFGQHWQDETWHEVLRLICNITDAKFTKDLISYLVAQDGELEQFRNIFLAAKCLTEIKAREDFFKTNVKIISELEKLSQYKQDDWMSSHVAKSPIGDICSEAVTMIARLRRNEPETVIWLKNLSQSNKWLISGHALKVLVKGWKRSPGTLRFIQSLIKSPNAQNKYLAVSALARVWKDDRDTLSLLKFCAQSEEYPHARAQALKELARGWKDDPDILPWLKYRAIHDEHMDVRMRSAKELIRGWKNIPETLSIVKSLAQSDKDSYVRQEILDELSSNWPGESGIYDFLHSSAINDPFEKKGWWDKNPRKVALKNLLTYYPLYPETIKLLNEISANDPDKQLREWAQEQLNQLKSKE